MAEGGDLDPVEKRRLQKYEYLVDQDYDPFHEKCGKEVFFSDERLVATSKLYGLVFSTKPIPVGEKFQVKLLDRGVYSARFLVSAQSNLSYTLYVTCMKLLVQYTHVQCMLFNPLFVGYWIHLTRSRYHGSSS